MNIGYARVSTDKQDADGQELAITRYAREHGIELNDLIKVEVSSRKDTKSRRIDDLVNNLGKGDYLICTEMSRLGRDTLETPLLIVKLAEEQGVNVVFTLEPQYSFVDIGEEIDPVKKGVLAIFSSMNETARKQISLRTKQGLAAAKARGVKLGRKKGQRNKRNVLDPHKQEIKKLLEIDVALTSIMRIINDKLPEDDQRVFNAFKYYVKNDPELAKLWKPRRKKDDN